MSTPREVMEEWFDRLWCQRDASVIRELRADTAQSHGLAASTLDVDAFETFFTAASRVFKSSRAQIIDFVTEGERCAMRVRFTATASGREITFDGAGISIVRDGKIVESWNLWDVPKLCAQLGLQGVAPTTIEGVVAWLDTR